MLEGAREFPAYAGAPPRARAARLPDRLPAYLVEHYRWAYLRPASLKVFDHNAVVSAILWGCYGLLKRAAFGEFRTGQRVLQAACVYGDLSPRLAGLLGPGGGTGFRRYRAASGRELRAQTAPVRERPGPCRRCGGAGRRPL